MPSDSFCEYYSDLLANTYADQERMGFRYEYSVFQLESSRNLLFNRGRDLERLFQGVIDRTRAHLDIPILRTLFGRKKRPFSRHGSSRRRRCEVAVETPEYDMTIFKIAFGLLGLKIYSKGERVLRIEATAHNAKALHCGCILDKFPVLVQALSGMVIRFLDTLRGLDVAWIQDTTLDDLPISSTVGKTRVGGIHLHQSRTRAVFHAVTALAAQFGGFTSRQLAKKVTAQLREPYTPRQAAYDLKKLRGKGLVTKIGKTKRYESTQDGLRTLTGLLTIRDKVIQPVLAQVRKLKPGPKPPNAHPLDAYYETLQKNLCELFTALNLALA